MVGGEGLPGWACGENCAPCRHLRLPCGAFVLPQTEPSQERIGVVARSATWREILQFLDVSSSQNHVLRLQSGHEASYHVRRVLPPFLFAQPFVSADPDIVFEGAPFVRQMAKLHGFHDAVHDHGGTEAGPQPQEQHLSTLIAPEGLHRGIIHELYWTLKRRFKVIAHPPATEETRVRKRSIFDDRPGIADRYRVVLPVPGKLFDAVDHLLGGQCGAGGKLPRFVLSGGEDLDGGPADVNNQHVHGDSLIEIDLGESVSHAWGRTVPQRSRPNWPSPGRRSWKRSPP